MADTKPVVKITQKIASVGIAAPKEQLAASIAVSAPVLERLDENLKRPDALQGRTYKIKPPILDHALYLTINDIILNEGTEHESRQPFEIFINSKEMESYQWIVALTRLVSAVFRKGGDALFMVEELKSVFDPNGGYFSSKRKGRVPSLVAEIGMAIEEHFTWLGLIKTKEMEASTKAFIAAKTEAFTAAGGSLDTASDCKACNGTKCVIILDKCPTCTNCGESKCG